MPIHIPHYCSNPKSPKPYQRKTSDECKRCGVVLDSPFKQFCDCCIKYQKDSHRRKARYKRRANVVTNATVENIDAQFIYDRDDYICYLCEMPIPEELLGDYKHVLSPTLDHVVPVSKGGHHWQSNVKASHRICNSIKQEKSVTDELIQRCKERIAQELETYHA